MMMMMTYLCVVVISWNSAVFSAVDASNVRSIDFIVLSMSLGPIRSSTASRREPSARHRFFRHHKTLCVGSIWSLKAIFFSTSPINATYRPGIQNVVYRSFETISLLWRWFLYWCACVKRLFYTRAERVLAFIINSQASRPGWRVIADGRVVISITTLQLPSELSAIINLKASKHDRLST